ncbi:similar to Saccharomyces cerevisiae YHR154W RTT107 Protein implicated in Mms22-dependent DNA repair during S phase [Maudiozyma saulgeensis]|uniref:Similar to Saccharomyces cerevisiae YHR154W RTT107 Protein implicated in Mms22-dependent DNA repair during S phase n=1 Tax=Maudiozyma saulgeensis TaxID=1789683 RepID=A0A1X7RAX6_9SACH|nr:similar to Saccharomyces cerevisiae YHR154W RTT107 Protein implicated in Mms22-dependent DNA repair during S phase [Kazachstania saulgeensis]
MSLFQDLNILIVVTNPSQIVNAKSTQLLLEENGCNCCITYNSYDKPQDLQNVSSIKKWFYEEFTTDGKCSDIHFIIAEDINFNFYKACAFDLLIPVINSNWVHDSLNCNRLNKTTIYSPNPLHIFKDYEFYISKCTFNKSEYFFYTHLIISLGGSYTDVLSSNIDFLISRSYMDPSIVVVQKGEISNNIKFIFPTWLLQCFKANYEVPWESHLLTKENSSQLNELWSSLHTSNFNSISNVLNGKTFKLDQSLKLDHNVLEFLNDFITFGNGHLTDTLDSDMTILIACEAQAVRPQRCMTANLLWLFDTMKLEEYVCPDSKIIYKPFKDKIFDEHINLLNASFTKYFGYQRLYIKLLIERLGGKASTDFSKRNNFLICQIPRGRKYNTAMTLWKNKCTVVNHLWLEDCYLLGEKLDPTLKKYSIVPVENGLDNHINQVANSLLIKSSSDTHLDVNNNDNRNQLSQSGTQITIPIDEEKHDLIDDPIEVPSDDHERLPPRIDNTQFSVESDGLRSSVENERIINRSLNVLRSGLDLLSKTQSNITDMSDVGSPVVPDVPETKEQEATPSLSSALSSSNYMTASMGPAARNLNEQLTKNDKIDSANEDDKSENNDKRTIDEDITSETNKKRKTVQLQDKLSLSASPSPRSNNGSTTPQGERDSTTSKAYDLVINFIEKSLINNSTNSNSNTDSLLPIYDIRAIQTSCLDKISKLDMEILRILGIQLFSEIHESYHLNSIFAPKVLRTKKFLQSLSFSPLKYALKPDFIDDLLKNIRRGGKSRDTFETIEELRDNASGKLLSYYAIPEIPEIIKTRTTLPTKVFEREGIETVNIFADIAGGTNTITDILKSHGIQHVNILNSKFTADEILKNEHVRREEENEIIPDYIVIVTKRSQVKRLTPMLEIEGTPLNTSNVSIVEWDWFVKAMFNLEVNFKSQQDVLHFQKASKKNDTTSV